MWIPKGVALIRERRFFETRHLFEKIRDFYRQSIDEFFLLYNGTERERLDFLQPI